VTKAVALALVLARGKPSRPLFSGVALALGLAAFGATPVTAAVNVTLTAEDGVQIAGTLWEPGGRAGAAVVMVAGPLHGRSAWARVGEQLAARGMVALAIDLRGQGGSGDDPGEDRTAYVRDLLAAFRFLQARPDAHVSSIGIAGASLGATLAVLATGLQPAVRSLVLLSPVTDFRGLKIEEPLKRVGERAVLLIASGEDAYAARSARALAQTGPGLRELQLLDGAGNGTRMLAVRPELVSTLVDWFSRTLL
jgi:dienelactone hydrolase